MCNSGKHHAQDFGAYRLRQLTYIGTLHFLVNVVSQYLRRKRVPRPKAAFYYGFITSLILGQIISVSHALG
ncbi:hypothetical protein A0123_02247 [Gluconobacter cerinus]|uniref:Uncharacterized protein n=1 Tax=Gluconobacter cerinus TaxID=38307 RepID=A0A1B6VIP2_9PROT|nr:hypothetical protein A0123_02247 [Gluconobacter cerinus]